MKHTKTQIKTFSSGRFEVPRRASHSKLTGLEIATVCIQLVCEVAPDQLHAYIDRLYFMTLTEKILARAAGKANVSAGENVWVKADILMTHDVCGPGTIGVFKREFGKTAKVWDRTRVVIIPDHYIFTADSKSNRNVDILRDFSGSRSSLIFTM
jgi:hypothetical protein